MYALLRHVDYASRRGWIPVIDMQNVDNLYLDGDSKGVVNSWEWFFDQPCGFGLDDIAEAQNVIASSHNVVLSNSMNSVYDCVTDKEIVSYWRDVASRYLRLLDETVGFSESMKSDVFGIDNSMNRVLGVYCRGTDYLKMKPRGHNV